MTPVSVTTGEDGELEVVLRGEIDYTNAAAVTRLVREAVERTRPRAVRVDLAQVSFLDSSGIAVLVSGWQAADTGAASFRVTGPVPRVFDLLQMTGLTELFAVEPPVAPPADGSFDPGGDLGYHRP